MPARDAVKRHYESYLGDGRPSLPVPEWSDPAEAPFTIYWKPLTLFEYGQAFPDGKIDVHGIVRLILRKAEDKEGARLFPDQEDHAVLSRKADHTILRRVAEQMLASPSVQDLAVALAADEFRTLQFWLADKLGKTIAEVEEMTVARFKETLAYYRNKADKA